MSSGSSGREGLITPQPPIGFSVFSLGGAAFAAMSLAPLEACISALSYDSAHKASPSEQYDEQLGLSMAGFWIYAVFLFLAIISLGMDARDQLRRSDGLDRRFTAGTSIVLAAGYIATIGCLIGIVLPELKQLAGENWEDGKEDITSHDFDDISIFLILTAVIPLVAIMFRFGVQEVEDKCREQGSYKAV